MERSRPKRNYYYDQDSDSETLPRSRARYNHHYTSSIHRPRGGGSSSGGRPSNAQDSSLTVVTSYRILCHDMKVGGVMGKSGSIIKSIRQHTGAWINVHELVSGDEERIIEISDLRRRDPEGRMPSFSPAQEALLLIHERILESDAAFGEEEDYGGRGGGSHRVATRLVVSRMHVGCLLGKRGKIIEQMRNETKTQIRVLPRDHNLPRCVSMSEEVVQVVGDVNAVKNALVIIASRLREDQHRDRTHFHGRVHSPERYFSPDDDYIPNMPGARRLPMKGPTFGPRLSSTSIKSNNYSSSSYAMKSRAARVTDDAQPLCAEDIVFRVLCPTDKVNRIIGESGAFVEFLKNEVGVDVKVVDSLVGSDERIVIISSNEGPDHELFPAQEAVLHIQTCIVDLILDKDNFVTTKIVVPSSDIECLDGKDASLSEIGRLTGVNIQIMPKEELPPCVAETDEVIQIEGEIKAARETVLEVTERLRKYLFNNFYQRNTNLPTDPLPVVETSSNIKAPVDEVYFGIETPSTHQNLHNVAATLPSKETGGSSSETGKQKESDRCDVLSNRNSGIM